MSVTVKQHFKISKVFFVKSWKKKTWAVQPVVDQVEVKVVAIKVVAIMEEEAEVVVVEAAVVVVEAAVVEVGEVEVVAIKILISFWIPTGDDLDIGGHTCLYAYDFLNTLFLRLWNLD